MAIITGEDLRRLVESRHDARACDPSKLSASPQWQQSLAASCEALTQGHEALRRAALHAHVETQESDSARIGRASAVEAAGRQYRYVYQKARLALATDDPEDPMPEELLAERTKQFEQTFAAVPSSLEGLGSERAAEFLDQGARLLKTFDPDEFGDLVRRLEQAAQRLHAANDQWRREVSEDRAATDALKLARAQHDRAAKVHALLVEAALVEQGREAELGRFLLAQDPAYRARRAAGLPVEEDVDQPLA